MVELQHVIVAIQELCEDSATPKGIKQRLSDTVVLLQGASELSMKVSQALNVLEELSEDLNMQPFTRSQLFNIASLLESV